MEEPTEWLSPAFLVPKQSGGDRIVVDLSHLNKFIKRPMHPFPTGNEIAASLNPTSKYFCKLDAVQSFYQVCLDDKSSLLTTFLLLCGHFRHLCAPMGCSLSSNKCCRQSNAAIDGVLGTKKLVDDILIEACNLHELYARIHSILANCRRLGITISRKKLEVSSEVQFARFYILQSSIRPDPSKLKAISDFPAPTSLSSLCNFMGMINQMSNFSKDLAALTLPLRPLLKKGVAFLWLPEHQNAFDRIKSSLTNGLKLHHFDPSSNTYLLTDASWLNSLCIKCIIQCGSRALSSCESKYATIELEMLAVVWALDKCQFYLKGMPNFTVAMDHHPLFGIFQKAIPDLMNLQLARLCERVMEYSFNITWLEGKRNVLADMFSRNPIDPAPSNPYHIKRFLVSSSSIASDICKAMDADADYSLIKKAISSGSRLSTLQPFHPGRQLRNVWDDLSIMEDGLICVDGCSVFIPSSFRRKNIEMVHTSHQGIMKSYHTARKFYHWPGLANDIKNTIGACHICQMYQPKQRKDLNIETKALHPMEQIGVDLFHYSRNHFLVAANRFSGKLFIWRLHSLSSQAIFDKLSLCFVEFGLPRRIRSDGGPQFRSVFKKFCSDNWISHKVSSLYHPESNGLSEVSVRIAKMIMKKSPKDFHFALACFNNTCRGQSDSPNNIFFQHCVRSHLPIISDLQPTAIQPTAEDNVRTDCLRPLSKGQPMWILDDNVNWTIKAIVASMRPNGRSYILKTKSDIIFVRNRKFLRPCYR